ncbi:MAG: hypothetical protein AB1806_10020 [Acidobacteriota bacterium]
MKKSRRRKTTTGGPYVAVAVLCEKVLHERDNTVSLIRIVDRLTISASADAPEEMPPVQATLTVFLAFKAGFARGKYRVTVRPVTPTGDVLPEVSMPALFEGDERGVQHQIGLSLQFREEGLYWFDVLIEDLVVTRVPLRVLYQRIGSTAPMSSS